jgi:hypothetical protein
LITGWLEADQDYRVSWILDQLGAHGYLCEENRILKGKANENGRLRFTDDEYRSLVGAVLAMG